MNELESHLYEAGTYFGDVGVEKAREVTAWFTVGQDFLTSWFKGDLIRTYTIYIRSMFHSTGSCKKASNSFHCFKQDRYLDIQSCQSQPLPAVNIYRS